jgi:hypothetical protein
MIASTNPPRLDDPFLYVGAALVLLAFWILAGVFAAPKLLPKLPSERSAERHNRAVNTALVEGQELERRIVKSVEELGALQADHKLWMDRTSAWLAEEDFQAIADRFVLPTGVVAADVSGSYNGTHSNLRLRINAQNTILRELLQ